MRRTSTPPSVWGYASRRVATNSRLWRLHSVRSQGIVMLIPQDIADLSRQLGHQKQRYLTVRDSSNGELRRQRNPHPANRHRQVQLPPIPPASQPDLLQWASVSMEECRTTSASRPFLCHTPPCARIAVLSQAAPCPCWVHGSRITPKCHPSCLMRLGTVGG
jgi:hypothetical protein